MVRHILRDLALPITWLLLHTKITANQVTSVALIIGMIGGFLISSTSQIFFLCGVLLLQFWYLLDHVDGQIARYHKNASISGRFYDFLMHHLIHAILPFFMGFYFFKGSSQSLWIVFGFIGTVSAFCFNMIYDIRAKAILEVIDSSSGLEVLQAGESSVKNEKVSKGFPVKVFSLLHKTFEIHVMLNMLLVSALIDSFFNLNSRNLIYIYYLCITPLVSIIKNYHIIHHRKVDSFLAQTYTIKK